MTAKPEVQSGKSASASAVDRPPTVLVIMGVSGSGKTTLAKALANELGWQQAEGDDLHPEANVAKMAAGRALTDTDRQEWLERVASWIDCCRTDGKSGVITCSALKRRYRDLLARDEVTFVHLVGNRAEIRRRLDSRVGHYMSSSLLDSQFDSLEEPGPEENVVSFDIDCSAAALTSEVILRLELIPVVATFN